MNIRRLGSSDAASLRALRLQSVTTDLGSFGRTHEEEQARTVEWYAAMLGREGDDAVIGAFDGASTLVGMVGLRREEQARRRHRMNLWGMYVAPEARGRGVGRRLVEAALALARRTPGVLQVHLGVTSRAPTARALYAALGFESVGRLPRGLLLDGDAIDEELMVCLLDRR